MYLMVFHFNFDLLQQELGKSHIEYAQEQIMKKIPYSFTQLDTFSYIGDEMINTVQCVLAIQYLEKELVWFRRCLTDARLLKIDSNEDLIIAI